MCAFHLPPRGRVPSTQSTIFSNLHWLVFVEKTKISKKEAGLAHLKRKKIKIYFPLQKCCFLNLFTRQLSAEYNSEKIYFVSIDARKLFGSEHFYLISCVWQQLSSARHEHSPIKEMFFSLPRHIEGDFRWPRDFCLDNLMSNNNHAPHWLLFLLTAGHTVIVAQLVKLTTTALKCCHFSAISVRWRFFLANCKILYARKRPYACF